MEHSYILLEMSNIVLVRSHMFIISLYITLEFS